MDYTKEQILEKVNTLIGKEVNIYDVAQTVKQMLIDIIGNTDIVWTSFVWSKSYSQSISFYWKDKYLLGIDYKRKKGQSHYSWYGGSYTDYTFKSFEIYCPNEFTTLKNQVLECTSLHNESEKIKNNKIAKAKEIYEHIVNTFDMKCYELDELLAIMNDKHYTWWKEIKGE